MLLLLLLLLFAGGDSVSATLLTLPFVVVVSDIVRFLILRLLNVNRRLDADLIGDNAADTLLELEFDRLLFRFGLVFSLLGCGGVGVPLLLLLLLAVVVVLFAGDGIEARTAAAQGALLCGGGSAAELLPLLLSLPLPIMRLMRSKKPNESRLALRTLAAAAAVVAAADTAAAAAASPFTVFRGE